MNDRVCHAGRANSVKDPPTAFMFGARNEGCGDVCCNGCSQPLRAQYHSLVPNIAANSERQLKLRSLVSCVAAARARSRVPFGSYRRLHQPARRPVASDHRTVAHRLLSGADPAPNRDPPCADLCRESADSAVTERVPPCPIIPLSVAPTAEEFRSNGGQRCRRT